MMTMKSVNVEIGKLRILGLMGEDNQFYFSVSNYSEMMDLGRKNANRAITRALKDCPLIEDTDIQRTRVEGVDSPMQVLPLHVFVPLTRVFANRGYYTATVWIDLLAGLSLHQLFCDSFKLKFEAEERQEWLRVRTEQKATTADMGDAIKWFLETHKPGVSENDLKFTYSNVHNALYRRLLGKEAKDLRQELGVPTLLRDHFGKKTLRMIETIQRATALKIRQGVRPYTALMQVCDFLKIPQLSYKE